MKQISVDPDRCAGCGNCVARCRYGLIKIVNKVASIREEKCTYCGRCEEACNYCAIAIEEIEDPVMSAE